MSLGLCPWDQKWPRPMCHQGNIQLSTDTFMLALNKSQVSDLVPLGPLVFILTTNADPDVTLPFVACHLCLHCFPKYLFPLCVQNERGNATINMYNIFQSL